MDRSSVNLAVDAALLLDFIALTLSGLLLWPRFLAYGNVSVGIYSIVSRDTVILVHDWSALLLILLIAAHLSLHAGWLRKTLSNRHE